ncbi:MAG TPA: helix-turn-helix transcriptional regulator [Gemmatimonadaceae bacterium]|jgi:transcriptional regulator with XRE-family HTH domain|nr:helix-turn-helix transcriptional regulator [Gemmatimonadaceae bacterium]
MAEWIGRELERIRKLRGLRREDVAARMARPVSASTIRNIEHDEDYNVSLDLLQQIAAVLGAKIQVSLEAEDLKRWQTPPGQRPAIQLGDAPPAEAQERLIDNEYFIRYIRARYPDCPLTNSQIGRRMWDFAKPRGAELVKGRMQVKKMPTNESIATYRLPTTAAQYRVRERDMEVLHGFADRLGRAYRDEKGRVLVPLI